MLEKDDSRKRSTFGSLKEIPSFMESVRRDSKMKVLLRNQVMKVWMIEISKIGGAMFFENGWEKVVKDNCVTDGDQLLFIYKEDCDVFDFIVIDSFGCEKIGVEGEHAQVVECIRKGSGGESRDVFVLKADIYSRVKKNIKKEVDMDMDIDIGISVKKNVKKEKDAVMDANAREEENDDGHHRAIVSQDMDATEEDDDDDDDDGHTLPQEKKIGSSGSKRGIPEHYGADLFLSGRYIQPDNAYFVTRIRTKRRGDLYVPKEVVRDYNLKLPPTVTLRDIKGREWTSIVKVWADGRTWLSGGWRPLCRRNLIGEEDQCICEFLPPQLGNQDNMVLQITVVKEDATLVRNDEDM
ncbi:PREDICTED: B3 domain-containing protein At5g60130-like isoform X2 [Ipomoea nil]|nr:PREDICTED: B3 domain-containing protein At5g60130-like isoform X2 [Ipomoea nil]